MSGENEMMHSERKCWHGVTDGSQDDDDDDDESFLANDSHNTVHLIITDTDNKVGR